MNRFLKVIAVAAAGFAVAWLAPAQTWAGCPAGVPINTFSGGFVMGEAPVGVPFAGSVGGTFWISGQGNDLTGPGDTTPGFGNDAGGLAGFPLDPTPFVGWLVDFIGDNSSRAAFWDFGSSGSDGCGDGVAGPPLVVVARDDQNRFALMQVPPNGAAQYDFDTLTNGVPSPNGGIGAPMGRAVHATSSSDLGSTVQVTVGPLAIPSYDDQGGARAIPGTPRLRGRVGGVSSVVANGGGGGVVAVDADTDLCWELVDGSYTVTLGCLTVGGNTPSQNVVNGKAGFAKGGAAFTWDVTAQFDVLGFNVYQKNVTKGSERKINDGLIPISGENDATAESYKYVAPRSDLRAWKGGFEIELVRSNGETSRAPVTIAK